MLRLSASPTTLIPHTLHPQPPPSPTLCPTQIHYWISPSYPAKCSSSMLPPTVCEQRCPLEVPSFFTSRYLHYSQRLPMSSQQSELRRRHRVSSMRADSIGSYNVDLQQNPWGPPEFSRRPSVVYGPQFTDLL